MEDLPQLPNNKRSHHVYMPITDLDGNIYSDQTGRFPITPNRGNCYVVIFYAVDGNYIKAYPIKSHPRSQLLKAYDDVYDFLRVRGFWSEVPRHPKRQTFEGSTGEILRSGFRLEGTTILWHHPRHRGKTSLMCFVRGMCFYKIHFSRYL